jgi:hypothetical protein
MNARMSSLLPRDKGEHVYWNVDSLDLPWLYPVPRLAGPVAQGHGAGVSRPLSKPLPIVSFVLDGGMPLEITLALVGGTNPLELTGHPCARSECRLPHEVIGHNVAEVG